MRTVDKEMVELKFSSTNSLNIRNGMSGNGAAVVDPATTGRSPNMIHIMRIGHIADSHHRRQL
jgi:hypothetical protein